MIRCVHNMMLTAVVCTLVSVTAFADGWQAIGPPAKVVHSFAFDEDQAALYAATDSGLMRLTGSGGWQFVRKNDCIQWPVGSQCISYLRICRHPRRQDLWFAGWQEDWFGTTSSISRMASPEGIWEQASGSTRSLAEYNITFNSFNPAVIYGSLEGFIRSDDTGKTWVAPAGESAFREAGFIAPDIRRQATLYTVGAPGLSSPFGVYKTTNNGSNWSIVYRDTFGYALKYSSGLAAGDTVVIGIQSASLSTESGVLFSVDGGTSWRMALRGVSVTTLARDMSQQNYIFAGTSEGLYISGNRGITWEPWNTTLPRYPITQIETVSNSDTVYVATRGGGMFRVFGFSTAIGMEPVKFPDQYSLLTIYPNPFNPVTKVEVTMPQGQDTYIEAVNVLGRRVAVLKEGYIPEGKHSYEFDGNSLPSGVYYIRVRLGGRQFVRPAMLLR